MVNIALPKGRLGEQVYALFEKAGLECPDILSDTRKLFFENKEKGIRFFWVKPSDVAVYVGRGAADLGIAGSDVLLEHQPDVYELLDLGLGVCRMMVAAPASFRDNDDMTLRVATKFPNIASRYYAGKSRDIDIIELHGSIELAPLLGLSDVIVDIVETGNTLKANGLEPKAEVVSISARLIANKASFKFKTKEIERVTEALSSVLR
ncbi:MAG: ATP phosphoribosyltransferase [Eubacterium sp.]|nr:ATP phosphoribosyltransferase [Eubacterium sp.]